MSVVSFEQGEEEESGFLTKWRKNGQVWSAMVQKGELAVGSVRISLGSYLARYLKIWG